MYIYTYIWHMYIYIYSFFFPSVFCYTSIGEIHGVKWWTSIHGHLWTSHSQNDQTQRSDGVFGGSFNTKGHEHLACRRVRWWWVPRPTKKKSEGMFGRTVFFGTFFWGGAENLINSRTSWTSFGLCKLSKVLYWGQLTSWYCDKHVKHIWSIPNIP